MFSAKKFSQTDNRRCSRHFAELCRQFSSTSQDKTSDADTSASIAGTMVSIEFLSPSRCSQSVAVATSFQQRCCKRRPCLRPVPPASLRRSTHILRLQERKTVWRTSTVTCMPKSRHINSRLLCLRRMIYIWLPRHVSSFPGMKLYLLVFYSTLCGLSIELAITHLQA